MQRNDQQTLNYATPESRSVFPTALRTGAAFVVLVLDLFFAYWFWNNYFRIGPEWLEPVLLLLGWPIIALIAGVAFVQLVRGIKALPAQ